MNDITVRFLAIYEYLRKNKIVRNPKGFAMEINVSPSLITEICKKRTNAGITPIQNLLQKFTEIDANWLLTGTGVMLKSKSSPTLNYNIDYKELAEARFEIIEMKNEKIESLEHEIAALLSRPKS